MSSRSRFVGPIMVAVVLFGFGLLCVWNASAESNRSSTAAANGLAGGLIRYNVPGDETIFALSLRTPTTGSESLGVAGPHDHVILIDTSASQTGAHRKQATQVLEACLAALHQDDRVRLLALDSQVKHLTNGFFAPQSAEVKDALRGVAGARSAGRDELAAGVGCRP